MPDCIADSQSPAPSRGVLRGCSADTLERRLYLHPVSLSSAANDRGRCLAGGHLSFDTCEVVVRDDGFIRGWVARIDQVLDWAESEGRLVARHVSGILDRLTEPRRTFAGMSLDRPRIMGIVNATPDSFHDRGAHASPAAAIAQARRLVEDGADVIDVGGESTRPGADPVPTERELARVLPVLHGLANCGTVISIDTYKTRVMEAALGAGAAIVNDVTALEGDPGSLAAVTAADAPVILGHKRGEPKTMNLAPAYRCAPLDVYDELAARVSVCLSAGIDRHAIAIDPGFGFGKSPPHNTAILRGLALLHGLGCPIVVGASHKAFEAGVGKLVPQWISESGPGASSGSRSLLAALAAVARGASIIRVHDVAEIRRALIGAASEVL